MSESLLMCFHCGKAVVHIFTPHLSREFAMSLDDLLSRLGNFPHPDRTPVTASISVCETCKPAVQDYLLERFGIAPGNSLLPKVDCEDEWHDIEDFTGRPECPSCGFRTMARYVYAHQPDAPAYVAVKSALEGATESANA